MLKAERKKEIVSTAPVIDKQVGCILPGWPRSCWGRHCSTQPANRMARRDRTGSCRTPSIKELRIKEKIGKEEERLAEGEGGAAESTKARGMC